MHNKERKCAFSLAEALITLLIVCLITIASIPILTKKKRQISNTPRGLWMCTRAESGQHYFYSSTTGSWTASGDSCVFTPPPNARNFEITAIGGGGGGASGFADSKIRRIYGVKNENETDFIAPADGEYEATVIGGGGQGGNRQNDKPRCQENIGGAGGTGGFDSKIIKMYNNKTYKIVAGLAGTNGGYDGVDGGASYIQDQAGNKLIEATGGGKGYGRWGAACGRYDKKDSEYGNWGRRGTAGSPNGVQAHMCHGSNDDMAYSNYAVLCSSEHSTVSALRASGKKIGNKNCGELMGARYFAANLREFPYTTCNGAKSYTAKVYGLPYGYGGKGRDRTSLPASTTDSNDELYEVDKDGNILYDENGKPIPYDEDAHKDDPVVEPDAPANNSVARQDGGMGAVLLRYNLIYSGEGGKVGQVDRPAVIPSLRKVTVVVGRGGVGASTANISGYTGGNTGYIIEYQDKRTSSRTALGGSGGRNQYGTYASVSSGGTLSGGAGQASSVQAFKANALGGFGGYSTGNADINGLGIPFLNRNYFGAGGGGGGANGSGDGAWGKGANGAPGAVIIDW